MSFNLPSHYKSVRMLFVPSSSLACLFKKKSLKPQGNICNKKEKKTTGKSFQKEFITFSSAKASDFFLWGFFIRQESAAQIFGASSFFFLFCHRSEKRNFMSVVSPACDFLNWKNIVPSANWFFNNVEKKIPTNLILCLNIYFYYQIHIWWLSP